MRIKKTYLDKHILEDESKIHVSSFSINEQCFFVSGDFSIFDISALERINKHYNIDQRKKCAVVPIFGDSYEKKSRKKRNLEVLFLNALDGSCSTNDLEVANDYQINHLIILAHGDGSHLKINDSSIICALVDEVERRLSGEKIKNGCSLNNCRRMNEKITNVIRIKEMEVSNLYLLSCNSACIAGDIYDSSSSLVRAFLKNGVQKILGCTELHDYGKEEIDLVYQMTMLGLSIYDISFILNQNAYRKTRRTPFCVFSKDIEELKTEILKGENFYEGEWINVKQKNYKIININSFQSEKFYIYKVKAREKITALLGYEVLMLINNNMYEIDVKIDDYTSGINELLLHIELIRKRINFWSDFWNQEKNNDIKKYLSDMHLLLIERERNISEVYSRGICDFECWNTLQNSISGVVKNVQSTILKNILKLRCVSTFEKYRILRKKVEKEYLCERCNNKTIQYFLCDNMDIKPTRMDFCQACGIRSIVFSGQPVYSELNKIPCEIRKYELKLKMKWAINIKVDLYLEMCNKVTGEKYPVLLKRIQPDKESISIQFGVDVGFGDALHTYRGLVLNELCPSYFKGRFV